MRQVGFYKQSEGLHAHALLVSCSAFNAPCRIPSSQKDLHAHGEVR